MSRKDPKYYDGNNHIFYSDDGAANIYLRAGEGQTLVVEGSGGGGGDLTGDITSVGLDTTYAGVVPVEKGGTGQTEVFALPTPDSYSGYDTNSNLTANNFLEFYVSTPTAASTTTLNVGSAKLQYFTGTTTQTIQMPVVSTLSLGQSWKIHNKSTGTLTIVSSGSNTITTIPTTSQNEITCISTSGTGASSWSFETISGGTSTLNDTNIFVGNASNVAIGVALSGDATMANTGALTLKTVNAAVGTFGSASLVPQVTVNAKGLITNVGTVQVNPLGASLLSNKFWVGSSNVAAVSNYSVPSSVTVNGLMYGSGTLSNGYLSTGVNQAFFGNASGVPTFSNQSLLKDGTELLPTYSFVGDPTAGMFGNSGDGSIAFATDETTRLIIGNTGVVQCLGKLLASDQIAADIGDSALECYGGLAVRKNLWVGGDYTEQNLSDTGVYLNIPQSEYTTSTTGTIAELPIASFKQNILNSTGTSTVTRSATVHIEGPPTSGTGMTITNPHSLWVESGDARFDGTISTTNGAFRLARYQASTSQSISTGSFHRVLFPTTVLNEISGLSYSSGTFTASIAMRVMVYYSIRFNDAFSSTRNCWISINDAGSGTNIHYAQQGAFSPVGGQILSSSTVLSLAVSDTVSLWAFGTATGTISLNNTYFISSIQFYTLP